MIPTDITIIGGGPTGLFAAFYAGMRKSSVKVIESMPQLGGQLSALYPDKYIYDVAGFPKVTAQELVDQLIEQASIFKPEYCLDEKVMEVHKRDEQLFEIVTNQQTHYSKSIIITAGCGAFEPRRISLPNATRFEQTNLFYFVNDVSRFTGLDVVIAGGGDSALDWALMLEPVAKSVTLVHRRDKFRAHEHSVELLEQSTVQVITPREITKLHGGSQITSITLSNQKLGITEEVHADALIISYGFVSSLGPIANWGLQVGDDGILVNSSMETNISGIYAAGDIAHYPGKVKLIAVGFGEAPTAINHAKRYIDPAAKVQPGHSSSMSF
ncbi:thioredoxin reductase (NADPH) [Thermoactinomyces sp. DSM 45891]|uniref:NAD(P)/FAD-dependent oxidoreductase n=1 Tax=Thermoactinomyces sp. DSM 45891 TaxID=1761907 RepID=UPI00091FFDF3|nr:NAD(P)/FAD-dependent oxidoreductase [Thermoactinomyces sp. DSM 45891]SFX42587.1 thioredoxin reductase (NADPH) [Thermoactinomyces sp. DSM 45891]